MFAVECDHVGSFAGPLVIFSQRLADSYALESLRRTWEFRHVKAIPW
jgi:hypothetical protein